MDDDIMYDNWQWMADNGWWQTIDDSQLMMIDNGWW